MIVVGRDPNCDTRLDSLRVSRHHCCMTRKNDQVVVRDLRIVQAFFTASDS